MLPLVQVTLYRAWRTSSLQLSPPICCPVFSSWAGCSSSQHPPRRSGRWSWPPGRRDPGQEDRMLPLGPGGFHSCPVFGYYNTQRVNANHIRWYMKMSCSSAAFTCGDTSAEWKPLLSCNCVFWCLDSMCVINAFYCSTSCLHSCLWSNMCNKMLFFFFARLKNSWWQGEMLHSRLCLYFLNLRILW